MDWNGCQFTLDMWRMTRRFYTVPDGHTWVECWNETFSNWTIIWFAVYKLVYTLVVTRNFSLESGYEEGPTRNEYSDDNENNCGDACISFFTLSPPPSFTKVQLNSFINRYVLSMFLFRTIHVTGDLTDGMIYCLRGHDGHF